MKVKNHTGIKNIVHRTFLMLWAGAIFWFYLGNLINFHQNRIWGKILIPACFTHSSVNSKDFGTLQNVDQNSFASLFDIHFDGISDNQIDPIAPVFFYIENISTSDFVTPVTASIISENTLRGPPTV
ncbi:MAG: hypothetical protein ACM3PX_00240 [Omnitrophica WOR_2 bacterium]